MRKAQIKRSWIVYPPNYKPGVPFYIVPFLKDAWNKACSLGEGAECWLKIKQTFGNGITISSIGNTVYVATKN